MGRIKGIKNRISVSESGRPFTSTLPLEERLEIIANLIIDRIVEDQQNKKLHITHIETNK
jgi:hypothetical protein